MAIATERKTVIVDMVKAVLKFLLLIVLTFAYWFALLMVISIFLLNIWRVGWEQILMISGGLTVLTMVVYSIRKVYKMRKNS